MPDHEERIQFLRDYLEGWLKLDDMIGKKSGAGIMARYLLENGEGFQGRRKPRAYRFDEVKGCFGNAARLAINDTRSKYSALTYYEGYALGSVGIPIHHAWNVDEDGLVVDTTWRYNTGHYKDQPVDPTEWAYFGVSFQADYLWEVLAKKKTFGILDWPDLYKELERLP